MLVHGLGETYMENVIQNLAGRWIIANPLLRAVQMNLKTYILFIGKIIKKKVMIIRNGKQPVLLMV